MLRLSTAFFLVTIMATFAEAQTPATPTPTTADPCVETKAQLTRLEKQLKDWPALGRYHDANTKVAAAAKDEQRVVFMGDSITDSWDDPRDGGLFSCKTHLDRGTSGTNPPGM